MFFLWPNVQLRWGHCEQEDLISNPRPSLPICKMGFGPIQGP